jgi:hypothetical protein
MEGAWLRTPFMSYHLRTRKKRRAVKAGSE